MIILRMQGGLGNQMFQYALYTALSARGRDVRMDEVTGFVNDAQRTPVLKETFGLDYATASGDEVLEFTDKRRDIISRLRRRLFGSRAKTRTETREGNFEPEILTADDVYLNGYWQSEKYFSDKEVQTNLRQTFALAPEQVLKTPAARAVLPRIRDTESVSVHIRRGDYVWPGFVEIYGNICTDEYYHTAIDYILERCPRAVFYIFSDDREWTAEHFTGDRFVPVGEGGGQTDTEDLLLMSECKHHIIANSSFSWWASWLNDAPEKLVIAPKRWLNNKELHDIYTDRMVRL